MGCERLVNLLGTSARRLNGSKLLWAARELTVRKRIPPRRQSGGKNGGFREVVRDLGTTEMASLAERRLSQLLCRDRTVSRRPRSGQSVNGPYPAFALPLCVHAVVGGDDVGDGVGLVGGAMLALNAVLRRRYM